MYYWEHAPVVDMNIAVAKPLSSHMLKLHTQIHLENNNYYSNMNEYCGLVGNVLTSLVTVAILKEISSTS